MPHYLLIKDRTKPAELSWFLLWRPFGSIPIHRARFDQADRLRTQYQSDGFAGLLFFPYGGTKIIVHALRQPQEIPWRARQVIAERAGREILIVERWADDLAHLPETGSAGVELRYDYDLVITAPGGMVGIVPRPAVLGEGEWNIAVT